MNQNLNITNPYYIYGTGLSGIGTGITFNDSDTIRFTYDLSSTATAFVQDDSINDTYLNPKSFDANWNANRLQGILVSATPPLDTYVLKYNSSLTQWEPQPDADVDSHDAQKIWTRNIINTSPPLFKQVMMYDGTNWVYINILQEDISNLTETSHVKFGSVELIGTSNAFSTNKVTTGQRNSLTAINGMFLYNTSTSSFNMRQGAAWRTPAATENNLSDMTAATCRTNLSLATNSNVTFQSLNLADDLDATNGDFTGNVTCQELNADVRVQTDVVRANTDTLTLSVNDDFSIINQVTQALTNTSHTRTTDWQSFIAPNNFKFTGLVINLNAAVTRDVTLFLYRKEGISNDEFLFYQTTFASASYAVGENELLIPDDVFLAEFVLYTVRLDISGAGFTIRLQAGDPYVDGRCEVSRDLDWYFKIRGRTVQNLVHYGGFEYNNVTLSRDINSRRYLMKFETQTSQTIATFAGTRTLITDYTVMFKDQGKSFIDEAILASTDTFKILVSGWYRLSAWCCWDSSNVGTRGLDVRTNLQGAGSTLVNEDLKTACTTDLTTNFLEYYFGFQYGDFFEFRVIQRSLVNRTINATRPGQFTLEWISEYYESA